jgi:hypothetical protein
VRVRHIEGLHVVPSVLDGAGEVHGAEGFLRQSPADVEYFHGGIAWVVARGETLVLIGETEASPIL